MERMNYNDRCYLMAVEMAQQTDIEHYDETDTVNTLIPAARIAVAKMAEAYEDGFKSCFDVYCLYNKFGLERMQLEAHNMLVEYGLIPDKQPESTTENNNWKL